MQLYRMHDVDHGGAIPCASKAEAQHWNAQGYGIFITVNTFNGPRRAEFLQKINAWAIDMDEGSKLEQRNRLLASPLVPSYIVETKRGYQAWWWARDGKPEHWNAIVLERLVPHFGSDKNARDICRILRKPGYLHLKDPKDPFLVTTAWKHNVHYSELQMAQAFKWRPAKQKLAEPSKAQAARPRDSGYTESLWDAIYALDCEDGLRRLSGHHAVGSEQYTFKHTSRDRLNIFVDGKGSSCFIDENKRIGSLQGGGPTLIQWLRYFGNDYKKSIEVLKEIYPHLKDVDAAANRRAA